MSRSQPAVRHGRRWLAPRVLGALAASAFVLLPAASGTAAPDDTSGTGTGEQEPNRDDMLTVAQEFGRSVDLGDHVLLRVTVTAGRLIDGEVRVTGSQSSLTVRQDVQVAGGSSEEVIVTVPVIDPGSASFEVELFDGDQSVDSDTVRFAFDAGTDVAGVMPVLAARAGEPPARVTLPGDLRRVDMVAVSLDVLDLGPSAISQLDTVLATSDDLVSLGPAARTTLLGWLDRGGHLVLDDTDDLSALPVGWQPGDAGYAFAGRGEVRVIAGALTAGEWDLSIAPAPLSAYNSPMGFGSADMLIDPRLTLAKRAGVELPDLNRIVVLLAVYVLLIGPVLYLVLRRMRRLTAAWVAIPTIALLVAGGVAVTSRGWNTAARSTAATIIESHAGGSHVSYQQLMTRRSGGTASFAVPAGWTPLDQNQFGWWGVDTSTRRTAIATADGTTMQAQLEPGQVAVLEAEGADDASFLVVDARIDNEEIRGTVTNTAGVDLNAVAVFGGGRGVLVGDLASGASVDYQIKNAIDDPDPFDTPLRTVWSDPQFGLGFGDAPTPGIDVGIWTWFASKSTSEIYPRGVVRAAGWTSELIAAGDASGETDNLALVTTVAPIMNDSSTLEPQVVRWSWIENAFDPRTGEPGKPVFRYSVPPDAPLDDLVLELPVGLTGAEVLDARGRWVDLGDDDDTTRDDELDVPASSVRDGSLIVRASVDMNAGVDFSLIHPVLRGLDT